MTIRFEWDPAKAKRNWRKHGIRFETAVRAFADPFLLTEPDRIVDGEQRWRTLGIVEGYFLLLVIYAIREEDEDDEPIEIIRLISARTADRKERRRYEQKIRSI
jgi:uncharacterized DUF497 family protein